MRLSRQVKCIKCGIRCLEQKGMVEGCVECRDEGVVGVVNKIVG